MQIKTLYQAAILAKYPEQLVVAIARDPQGKFNPITLGWTMITSGTPPIMAISVGDGRYSLEAIRKSLSFTLAFPSSTMASDVLYFGTHSGRDVDKLAECKTKTEPAEHIDSVLLSDAKANFECVVESQLETGDHVILAGRVVAAHVNRDSTTLRLYNLGQGEFAAVQRDD